MIDRQEILDFAADFGLDPNVVEKDYVLGWLLAGIGAHAEIGGQWLFKGGTCLKKCFFETYRFSEDLDFTVTNPDHINEQFLLRVFGEIAESVYGQAGIELPADTRRFEIYANPRGRNSVQGRVGYRGPMGRQAGVPRIRLDLTNDEHVVMEADRRVVHHPYSDGPPDGIHILTYRFEEVFAEKVRALAERLRPRDLYDVVHLYRRDDLEPDRPQVVAALTQKCGFKGIPVPTIATLQANPELQALQNDWEAMLRHQLPALPSFDEFWNELPAVFEWLFSETLKPVAAPMPAATPVQLDQQWHAPAMAASWRRDFGVTAPLELIRFAGVNRLCVELAYQDEQGRSSTRLIEPYSLRRTQSGDLLLHAVRHDSGQSRSYRVDRILGATVSKTSFQPRYAIELTASGPISAPPTAQRETAPYRRPRAMAPRIPSGRPRQLYTGAQGPKYVFECMVCRKRFERRTYDATLNPHKDKRGYPCVGRIGHYVTTKY